TAHVVAVGQRLHAGGEGRRRTTRGPTDGDRKVVRVAGDAEDLVEGVPAGAELRHVRLADGDRSRRLEPFDDQVVGVRDEIGPQSGAEGGADAGRQVVVLV